MITLNGVEIVEFTLNCVDDLPDIEEEEIDGAPEDTDAPE